MKAPKLTCVITGQSRVTSENYLKQKADRLGKSVSWLLENYISKHVCSRLRKGVKLSEITDTAIADHRLTDLVKNNSKCREEFSFVDGVYTPSKTKAPKVAKAPKADTATESKVTTLEEVVAKATDSYIQKKVEEPVNHKSTDEVMNDMVNNSNPF